MKGQRLFLVASARRHRGIRNGTAAARAGARRHPGPIVVVLVCSSQQYGVSPKRCDCVLSRMASVVVEATCRTT